MHATLQVVLQVTEQTASEVAGKIERLPTLTTGKKDTLSGIIVKEGHSIDRSRSISHIYEPHLKNLVVSLNCRDEVLSAEYHKIRASQGDNSPLTVSLLHQGDDGLKAVCSARLVAC